MLVYFSWDWDVHWGYGIVAIGYIKPPGNGPQVLETMFPFSRGTHFGYIFLTHTQGSQRKRVTSQQILLGCG